MVTKTKVLIVEDETIVALDIKRAINKLGFTVTSTATNYDEAIESVKENIPDIILMDINLHNSLDGIEVVKEIKKSQDIAVIYLTAFCDDDTISRAVETNPVGYLLKPFKIEELKSTIALGVYKSKLDNKTIDKTLKQLDDNYFYDEISSELYYKNKQINLTAKELKLLKILYKNKNSVVPFETIEHYIWEDNIVSNSTLRTLIYRLRAKLDYKLIETISGIGCRLNIN